jgi:dephospho-CoA kinase
VFGDEERRRLLERITHPRIAAEIAREVAELGADPEASADTIVVVDHPLLVETGQTGRFDEVVVVTASESTRLERLTAQRGITDDDARARMAAQADDAARREVATIVIDNDGAPIELEAQVVRVHDRLVETVRRRSGGA